jgi:hypothetical protein
MRDMSRILRWGLIAGGIASGLLALWLFLAPFAIVVVPLPTEPFTFESLQANPLLADCSPTFRQLVAPPTQGQGVLWLPPGHEVGGGRVPNMQPLCRDVGRGRALSSLGFAGTAVLALILGAKGSTRKAAKEASATS